MSWSQLPGSENLNRLKLVLVSSTMLRARSAAPAIHVPPILALSTALLKLARDTCYRSADSEVWLRVRELLACESLRMAIQRRPATAATGCLAAAIVRVRQGQEVGRPAEADCVSDDKDAAHL